MFRKSVQKIQFSLKSDTDDDYFKWGPSYVNYKVSLNYSCNKNFFDKCCRENQNTHFVCNNLYSQKWCRLWDNVEKYGTAGQATDDSIIRLISFACFKTMATDTHSDYWIRIALSLINFVRYRKMFYGYTYKNWETAQRLICHSDLFSQIARLKKAIRKRTFFCFSLTFTYDKRANCSDYNWFQKLVHIICIFSGVINV